MQIDGRGGDDILVGSIGADTLIGGSGEDLLMGGLGSDTYFASSAAGSRTYIVDHGGNDVLVLDGEIVRDGRASYRYLRDALSLTVGTAGAIVEIIGHYGQLAGSGAGRIETIIDGNGRTWKPATFVEVAAGRVVHFANDVVDGSDLLVATASDALDEIIVSPLGCGWLFCGDPWRNTARLRSILGNHP